MRTTKAFLVALGVALVGGSVWAQEPAREPAQSDEESAQSAQESTQADEESTPREPLSKIKFRENPYDLAYMYGSSQRGPRWGYFGYQDGAYGYDGRYPIDGYYRLRPRHRYGYSRFWTSGYGYGRTRTGYVLGYGRTIGQNGDLFLMAPTILAPVGPLTGVFYDGQ